MRNYIHRVQALNEPPPLPTVSGMEFRWIPGFRGYAVGVGAAGVEVWSCLGVKGLGRPQSGFVSVLTSRWRQRALWTDRDGYLKLTLHKHGRSRFVGVNQLVLLAFKGPCEAGMQALHNDGDRTNNHPDNLRWGTAQDNMDDRERHGNTPRGERSPSAKLRESDVRRIRQLYAAGMTGLALAEEYGIDDTHVGRIVYGKSWRHVPGALDRNRKVVPHDAPH